MMRNACGCNDHPDATTFIQVFRLLSTYSLLKPPKGANVTGSDMVKSLLDFNDLPSADNDKQEFINRLDELLTTKSQSSLVGFSHDHSYYQQNSSDCVVGFLAGFVAHRGQTKSHCNECKYSLICINDENLNPNAYTLINVRSRGYLQKPSAVLLNLISVAESAVMEVLSSKKLHSDALSDIISAMEQVSSWPLVGCHQHQLSFTRTILNYYLLIRMIFICRQENRIDNYKTNKSREYKKLSRL